MGTPTCVDKHDYPTDYKVKDKKGVWHVQCDCIVLVTGAWALPPVSISTITRRITR